MSTSKKKSWYLFVLFIISLAPLLPVTLKAFTSGVGPLTYGWHGKITCQALEELGFSDKAARQIRKANKMQDWDLIPVRILDHKRHFGRDLNQSHEEAFARNKAYLESERAKVIGILCEPVPDFFKARKVFGWCLHTTQDAFAHSNYWEMTEEDKVSFLNAVVYPDSEPPQGYKIVGSGPDSRDEYAYGHADHHKDFPHCPEGEEAFRIAQDGALQATREFTLVTRQMLAGLVSEERLDTVWQAFTGNQPLSLDMQ
ncbi:hypothetical protein JXM67_06015 [candidate division WOR-3 bacterium]|nr:hypothetical protein [candidate division WOR-3 bacterium]